MRCWCWILAWVVFPCFASAQPPAGVPGLARIEGQVVDKDTKQPVAGAKVVLVRYNRRFERISGDIWNMPDSPPGTDPDARLMAATASPHGEFTFVITRPERCMLFVSAPGYVRRGGFSFSFPVGESDDVHRVTVELERETSVHGRVVDGETSKPLAGLAVTAWRYQQAGMGRWPGGRRMVRSGV